MFDRRRQRLLRVRLQRHHRSLLARQRLCQRLYLFALQCQSQYLFARQCQYQHLSLFARQCQYQHPYLSFRQLPSQQPMPQQCQRSQYQCHL